MSVLLLELLEVVLLRKGPPIVGESGVVVVVPGDRTRGVRWVISKQTFFIVAAVVAVVVDDVIDVVADGVTDRIVVVVVVAHSVVLCCFGSSIVNVSLVTVVEDHVAVAEVVGVEERQFPMGVVIAKAVVTSRFVATTCELGSFFVTRKCAANNLVARVVQEVRMCPGVVLVVMAFVAVVVERLNRLEKLILRACRLLFGVD